MIWLVNIISIEHNSNGELSDSLCNSQNRGLTLVWRVNVNIEQVSVNILQVNMNIRHVSVNI